MVLSKDAKAIVVADIAPVQHPGHSWKKRELPDHTWDQSRNNAVTPMTFLFLETKVSCTKRIDETQDVIQCKTRSGQGVTYLYLSFFEQDTTFKCLNEIFLLLDNPALDNYFRSTETNCMKKEFVFVVDNGPQERPSSPLVQMCMVRLLRLLKLDKITQVSFAEYNSKRNFVERVHAEENRALAKHGPFSSSIVHQNSVIGSKEHRENMECMAAEINECLQTACATFAKKRLISGRGIKREDYLFDDEETLSTFLSLTEEKKRDFHTSYKVKDSELLTRLSFAWGIDTNFQCSYLEDYKLIQNELTQTTAWKDKYTTTLFSVSHTHLQRKQLQPIPDYMRWLKCCELHYKTVEEADLLEPGLWDEIPGLFLSTKILDLCYTIVADPKPEMIHLLALLSWTKEGEVNEYFSRLQTQVTTTLRNDQQRETLKLHPLFKNNRKEHLTKMCHSLKIPVQPTTTKPQLVNLILEKRGESETISGISPPKYNGKISAIPRSVSGISQLSVAKQGNSTLPQPSNTWQ